MRDFFELVCCLLRSGCEIAVEVGLSRETMHRETWEHFVTWVCPTIISYCGRSDVGRSVLGWCSVSQKCVNTLCQCFCKLHLIDVVISCCRSDLKMVLVVAFFWWEYLHPAPHEMTIQVCRLHQYEVLATQQNIIHDLASSASNQSSRIDLSEVDIWHIPARSYSSDAWLLSIKKASVNWLYENASVHSS